MADIKVVDESEVWWASTKEYTLDELLSPKSESW